MYDSKIGGGTKGGQADISLLTIVSILFALLAILPG